MATKSRTSLLDERYSVAEQYVVVRHDRLVEETLPCTALSITDAVIGCSAERTRTPSIRLQISRRNRSARGRDTHQPQQNTAQQIYDW